MSERTPECQGCGMHVDLGEYHPFAACLMFRACRDSKIVRANLSHVTQTWFDMGKREGEHQAAGQAQRETEVKGPRFHSAEWRGLGATLDEIVEACEAAVHQGFVRGDWSRLNDELTKMEQQSRAARDRLIKAGKG